MILLRFRLTLTLADGSEAEAQRAARRMLEQLAAEIVKASARWNDAGQRPEPR